MHLKIGLQRLHYSSKPQPHILLWLLLPLAWAYGLGVELRLFAYRRGWLKTHLFPVPVISLGNLTTGGTGKTPLVIAIARGLILAGKSVVILSRGYGAAKPIHYHRAIDPLYGDEAYMIQQQVPDAVVIVGKNRLLTIERAIKEYHPDFVILDDGFQYLRLARQVNIALVDGGRLFGNGHLLPAGPLREPTSALRRADMVLVTKEVSQTAMQLVEALSPKIPILPVPFGVAGLQPADPFSSQSQKRSRLKSVKTSDASDDRGQAPLWPCQEFQDRPVVVFSAIAQPDQLTADLQGQGLHIRHHFHFPDHHHYQPSDFEPIQQALNQYADENPILVTTDKDLSKAHSLLSPTLLRQTYTLQVVPALDGRWFYEEFLKPMTSLQDGILPFHSKIHDLF